MMTVETFNDEQGSAEWFERRRGLPTASRFATVLAKGEGKTRSKYMRELAAEIITGECAEGYKNAAMDRGSAMEAEIRRRYAFENDVVPDLVGFVRNGRKGASPDSLIGENGGIEIKSKTWELQIELLESEKAKDPTWVPPEFIAQIQGNLWVCEREWWVVAIGAHEKLPLFVRRVHRDESYILNLKTEINRFNDELSEMVERIRRYGVSP